MPLSDVSLEPAPVEPHRLGLVLFDLPADRFPALAADLRRLTRQPLRFRWLPTADDEPGRVLVRVESPPPLVMWRTLDGAVHPPADPGGSPTPGEPPASAGGWASRTKATVAYTEQAPDVWVQLGYRHPRPDRIRPPKGHILVLRAPDTVEAVPAGLFVEEIETLSLART